MTKLSSEGEYVNPVAVGPTLESTPSPSPPITAIPASGNYQSARYVANGNYDLIIALKSTQAGALNVQRYVDESGLLTLGAVDTVAIVANTTAVLLINDGKPIGSFTFQITNTGGSPATVGPIAIRNVPHRG